MLVIKCGSDQSVVPPVIVRCGSENTVATYVDGRAWIGEPTHCPACGSPTTRYVRNVRGAVTYCSNPKGCPAVRIGKIKHWVGSSKKGVGIMEIGDTIINALCYAGLVLDPADLYTLTVDDIKDIQLDGGVRIGESRAKKIIAAIEAKKSLSLPVFLGSLGIELLGRRRVELLMKEAKGELDDLGDWYMGLESLEIAGLGEITKKSILDGLNSCKPLVNKLLSVGVTIATDETNGDDQMEKPFAGMTFCLTGTRKYIDDIERLGGTVKSGVSKGLHFLVQADPTSVSSKTKKAESYGTTIISIDYLKRAIDGEVQLTVENHE